MKIGELSAATGTKVETIRYYEGIGLMPRPPRTDANYRDYAGGHVDRLNFIRHARGLGFDIPDIRSLLALGEDPERDCAEVDRLASGHLAAVERKIAKLDRLRRELHRLLTQCRGGQIADCRIMRALGEHGDCEGGHRAGAHSRRVPKRRRPGTLAP